MKALTEPSISFDRISTREELEEVLHLLADPHALEHGGISIAPEPDDPLLTDWRAELESDENEVEEQPSKPYEKKLMALLLQMDERTN